MKKRAFLIALFFFQFSLLFGQAERPKIGLTLSGGGAKGLAHIGILKALDSAGVKIDYITGTSMGAVVGSLYAIGYSGNEIEEMALSIDWDLLLSNDISIQSLAMEEKEEYGKYAIELPIENKKISLPTGVLEAQELWFKFADLYKPVQGVSDFCNFSIPFKCIATDIISGKVKIFDSGDLSTAVRASMAIPSVFTAVKLDDLRLVDGGLLRNFPVKDVKEMGADIIIGSSLSSGLYPKEKLNNAIDIILQLAFLKENDDFLQEVPLCDYYIEQTLDSYSMGSFNSSNEIIELGRQKGELVYPAFKHLADSLNDIYGMPTASQQRLPKQDSIFINDYTVSGLINTTENFFIHALGFESGRFYSDSDISNLIRRVYGTRYYSSINYRIIKHLDESNELIFTVKENPLTFAKIGIHYNDFSGISAIFNFTTRDLLSKYSRSLATYNLGENLRLKGEHMQYFGLRKNVAMIAKLQIESFKLNTYTNIKRTGQYRQNYSTGELKMQYSGHLKLTSGIGIRKEHISFKPLVESRLQAQGKNSFFTSFAFLAVNTFNKPQFPTKGVKLDLELSSIFNQKPDINFFQDGVAVNDAGQLDINYGNYQRITLKIEGIYPLKPKWTINTVFQSGINFNYSQNLVKSFKPEEPSFQA